MPAISQSITATRRLWSNSMLLVWKSPWKTPTGGSDGRLASRSSRVRSPIVTHSG